LPLLKPQRLSASQKEIYDLLNKTMIPWAEKADFQSKTDDGKLIGHFNPILFSPKISLPFLYLQKAEQKHTTLSERVRQVVILSVGAVWKSDYELYAHSAVGRKAGLSEEAIQEMARGETI
jgi:4-carboxymuconolactone decarboxylase